MIPGTIEIKIYLTVHDLKYRYFIDYYGYLSEKSFFIFDILICDCIEIKIAFNCHLTEIIFFHKNVIF